MKNMFTKPRFLFDVDSGNGSGAAPVTPPVTPPATPPEATPAPVTPPVTPTDDKDAKAQRYLNMTERQRREKAESRIAELEAIKAKQPEVFDKDTDPDGTKEIQYKINEGIKEGLQKQIKEMGLEEVLNQIKVDKELDQFFGIVDKSMETFKEFGITASREELQSVMNDLDTKGITPEQLIAITKLPDILKAMKTPGGFKPGEGGRANTGARVQTQEEIQAAIFAKHGVFQR